ncbi:hypothetical protein [Diaminobutyricimonas sp. LJ205]|uniref:hypothetical protein n=1 Tax=Diaminobutyricimonas sp. LJ205 TaxID=2683590 RepID=UPI0012F48FF6|nr:hypothetical protein [Diaminobutyricimonas sp. LJ205]
MNWSDPGTLAAFINAVAPSLIGGLLALAGVIGLFLLQQRETRRAETRKRLEDAAERLMETLEAARVAYTAKKARSPADLSDMLAKSWRFAWLLEKKERPVADWAWGKLFESTRVSKGRSQFERERAAIDMFAAVMARLNDWRVGNIQVSWFVADLARMKADKKALHAHQRRAIGMNR